MLLANKTATIGEKLYLKEFNDPIKVWEEKNV